MADGQNVPTNAPSSPTFAQEYQQLTAGIQPQTITASPIPMDMAKEILKLSGANVQNVPGAAQPYLSTPSFGDRVSMPQQPGRFATDRPQQLVQGTAQQRSQIGQQNLANALSNIVGGMANHFAQQKYEEKVKTIKSYTDLVQKAQEAQNVLNNDPTNEQARQVLASSSQELKNLMTGKQGEKNKKILEKAIPNFTDPSKNGEEVKAAQQAIQQTKTEAAQGIGDKTLAEKQVGDKNQQMTGGPNPAQQIAQGIQRQPLAAQNALSPMLQRALANTPMHLEQNPAYVAQQLRNQKVQDLVITKLGTTAMNVQGREAVQDMKDTTQRYNATMKDAIDKYKVDANNAVKFGIASQNNYVKWSMYQDRLNSLMGLSMSNPSMTGGAGRAAASVGFQIDKDINMIQKTNETREKDIQTMENQLNADRPLTDASGKPKLDSKGKPVYMAMEPGARRDEIEQNIRNLKAQIAIDNDHVKNLENTRDKYNDFATASGASPQKSGMETLRRQAGLGTDTPSKAADFNPTGGFQQWMPMVENIRSQQFPNVPPALAQAFLMAENRQGNPSASSKSKSGLQGGQGLFQLIPTNQKKYGINDWSDPADNATGALNMMSDLLQKSGGDVRKAIYGWAPKDGSDPGYTDRVFKLYQQLQAGGGGTGGGGTVSPAGSSSANQAGGAAVNTQQQPTTGGGGEPTATFIGPKGAITTSQFGTALGKSPAASSYQSVGPSEDDTGGIDIKTQ